MDIQTRLLDYLRSPEFEITQDVQKDTPLLDSQLLDSLGLFKLALWIEAESGVTTDFEDIDAAKEWNTVEQVAAFIRQRQAA
jgi:acyl carrier protein